MNLKHNVLGLFKLLFLEERVVIYATPARGISTSTLGLLSLMPGLLPSLVGGVYGSPTHDVTLSEMGLPLEVLLLLKPD